MNGLLWLRLLWGKLRRLSKLIVCGSEKLRGGFVACVAVDLALAEIPPTKLKSFIKLL